MNDVMQMELSEYELSVVAQATRELLLDRLFYAVVASPGHDLDMFRSSIELELYQRIFSAAVSVYGRATMMSMPDTTDTVDDQYVKQWLKDIEFSNETWEIIDKITLGSSWADVPAHTWHKRGCPICTDMQSVAVGKYS